MHAQPHRSHLPLSSLCRYEAKHEGKRDAKRKGGEGGGAPKPKRIQVGTSELSRLWNLGGNSLEEIAAGAAAKQSVPGLVEYLQPVLEQMDPAEGIEEEYGTRLGRGASHPRAHRPVAHLPLSSRHRYKMCNDKAYTWKALRLMAKKDVALLGQVSQPGGSLEKAVTWMHEKMKGSAKEEATDVMKAEGDAEMADAPEEPKAEEAAPAAADAKAEE